ncbi:large ribosomal subunit protein bL19m [Anolis carolinensis]|uniref:Large ribosomal subunit protein bL19m n=1 Tax=Anolis carolinensis TaxID=28377 RepID=A0A803TTE4_ANOCA|nr:PREDICTED: 39S ribosomal protein L19, mitochondrial [Anolis carolinensis]|eukprot:XP_003215367.2 PREDICTED: 39S ribosomal protein L19, mitochondrial [Anolis carolinensis]
MRLSCQGSAHSSTIMAAVWKRSCMLPGVARSRCLSLSFERLSSKDEKSTKFKPPPKPVIVDESKLHATERKFLSPEFIPPRQRINPLKFYIERRDMVQRRKVMNIPEFYAGSILAVTTADPYANGRTSTFVGLCVQRSGRGLGGTFVLRNVIEGQGIEICYELYNPLIQEIKVLKLEKRLDENLMYLRDALPEYSTVDVNMKPIPVPLNEDVPVNKMKVKMKPRPWSRRWEHPRFNIQGIDFDLYLHEKAKQRVEKWKTPWNEFDMMKEYDTSKIEKKIWEEVNKELEGKV